MTDLPEKHALARRLIRGCEDALADIERSGVCSDVSEPNGPLHAGVEQSMHVLVSAGRGHFKQDAGDGTESCGTQGMIIHDFL
jgi:hypothetical protein